LIDFDAARKCDDAADLGQELEHLAVRHGDSSTRGGGGFL
jgi:hypothetical protein